MDLIERKIYLTKTWESDNYHVPLCAVYAEINNIVFPVYNKSIRN